MSKEKPTGLHHPCQRNNFEAHAQLPAGQKVTSPYTRHKHFKENWKYSPHHPVLDSSALSVLMKLAVEEADDGDRNKCFG